MEDITTAQPVLPPTTKEKASFFFSVAVLHALRIGKTELLNLPLQVR